MSEKVRAIYLVGCLFNDKLVSPVSLVESEEAAKECVAMVKRSNNPTWLAVVAKKDYDRLAEINKVLSEALDEAKWFCQDQLARANQAINTDCPKCDYQCQGCIRSIDDCEALKKKVNEVIAKAKEMGK